ncbi:TrkA family potassium uptake protein [Halorutilales archaeon Cl-col2-1]
MPVESKRRKAVLYILGIGAIAVFYSVIYSWGMSTFEGRERSLVHSFQVVVETFTTTGYGEDAPWSSPVMLTLMVAMQLTGVVLIFMALPLFVVPWIEEAIETQVPTSAGDLEDHVVICEFESLGETLIDELESRGIEYVILICDENRAIDLYESGYSVVRGDPESTQTLRDVSIEDARSVVLDADNDVNASIALSVREASEDTHVVSLATDPQKSRYLRYAGSDEALSPRHIVGRSLADKATTAVTSELGESIEIGDDFLVVEIPVHSESSLVGQRLSESGIRETTGASLIGAWVNGSFIHSPSHDTRIDSNTVLLVAGTEDELKHLRKITLAEARRHRRTRENVVIAGLGEVGSTVRRHAENSGIDTTVIDVNDGENVDVVGDAADEEALREAGIEDAAALIVALPDDTSAIFTTLIAREINPDVEIIVRANRSESQTKLYRSGADYVLALPTVSGRVVALDIIGEEIMSPGKQIKIVRTEAPRLEGKTLEDAHVGRKTGCTVVAIDRDGEVMTRVQPDTRIQEGDRLIVAGSDENINSFREEFDGR